jgi:serine/threonine protein kinase
MSHANDPLAAGTHPSPEQLAAFLDGSLSQAELDTLEPHIAGCAECCAVLRGLPDDPVAAKLRSGGPPPGGPDPVEALAGHPRYHLLGPLGSGGMGTVYKARHRRMDRVVALKVIHPRLLRNPEAVERFHREAKAAARLTHPNIVAAHDADQAGGCHFLVMEFVEGQSLAAAVAGRGPLGVAEACGYARQAAAGLQHAFENGMVHRDIKPQNLMLTPQGRVKVLDFGLAHVVGDPDPVAPAHPGDTSEAIPAAGLTRASTVLGTPDYMAPEQVADPRRVDIRTDVYALGCTLYYLLAGRPPFPWGTPADKLAAHRGQEPPSLTAVRPDVPPGLAIVVGRMLAKDPADRFQTPAEVADALQPFAEPAPPRLNPRRLLLALAAVLAVAVVAVVVVPFLRPSQGSPPSDLPRPGEVLRLEGHTHSVWSVAFSRDGRYALTGSQDGTVRRWDLATGKEVTRLGPMTYVACAALTPDGRHCLATDPWGQVVRLWDIDTGAEIRRLREKPGHVEHLAISPDGTRALTGSRDTTMRLWDLATGDQLECFRLHKDNVRGVAFSPDGRKGLSAGWDGTVAVWDLTTMQSVRHFRHPDGVHSACFSPDGRRVLTGGMNQVVRLWDIETGQQVRTFAHGPSGAHSVAISPDGRRGLSAGASVICLWDLETEAELLRLTGHTGSVWSVAFSPDGRHALSGSEDATVRLWNIDLP